MAARFSAGGCTDARKASHDRPGKNLGVLRRVPAVVFLPHMVRRGRTPATVSPVPGRAGHGPGGPPRRPPPAAVTHRRWITANADPAVEQPLRGTAAGQATPSPLGYPGRRYTFTRRYCSPMQRQLVDCRGCSRRLPPAQAHHPPGRRRGPSRRRRLPPTLRQGARRLSRGRPRKGRFAATPLSAGRSGRHLSVHRGTEKQDVASHGLPQGCDTFPRARSPLVGGDPHRLASRLGDRSPEVGAHDSVSRCADLR